MPPPPRRTTAAPHSAMVLVRNTYVPVGRAHEALWAFLVRQHHLVTLRKQRPYTNGNERGRDTTTPCRVTFEPYAFVHPVWQADRAATHVAPEDVPHGAVLQHRLRVFGVSSATYSHRIECGRGSRTPHARRHQILR